MVTRHEMIFKEQDYKRAQELLQELTLEEKVGMLHGAGLFETAAVERVGIPALKMSDGPMGVRREFERDSWTPAGHNDDYVTYLPCNSAIAATWNRDLAFECGSVLGEEARGRGKDVILAPGINIKRSPLCGRNFEYMSEDPYLTGEQAVPLVQGIQRSDVAACVKHYALNNQERNRLYVNTEVDERALREIYLAAFHKVTGEGGALSLMGAYNLVRGSRCCENQYLLDTILRGEWDWDGVVVSDWGGILRTKESAEAAIDVEMSIYSNYEDYQFARPLLEAVRAGEIKEELIDRKVYRILCLMSALNMLDGDRQRGCCNTKAHQEVTLRTARESAVLLKNEDHLLPLSPGKVKRLLVIGDNATRMHAPGGGSAEIKALYEITPLQGLRDILGGETEIAYAQGYYVPDDSQQQENWQEDSLKEREGRTAAAELVVPEIENRRRALCEEAVALAAEYETVIYIGGLNHSYDMEDQDRRDMQLPYGQDALINALLDVRPNMVIVMISGSPVETYRWDDRAKAILWQWYAGMEGGTATAEILLGKVNPSGRLPETFPVTHMDCSAHCVGEFGKKDEVHYKESIYVGYRYYEREHVKVRYPFGHGLSYTEFAYGDCSVQQCGDAQERRIHIAVPVKNTGGMAGKEVVQLYLSKADSAVERPCKELKGYCKIALEPQEEQTVTFEITAQELAYYDEAAGCMAVENGRYQVLIGASSADIWSICEFDWEE